MADALASSSPHQAMANNHGFNDVEAHIKQITGLFAECRNVLADTEDYLETEEQLRAGEADKINEVDAEFIRSSSSIAGVWDRIIRFKGKAVIPEDDEIMITLEKAAEAIESRIYHELRVSYRNKTFLDYGSLIRGAQEESKPSVEALKALVSRLRGPGGSISTASSSHTVKSGQPIIGSIRPPSSSRAESAASFRSVRDPTAALGSSRHGQQGYLPIVYDPSERNGISLTPSVYTDDSPDEQAEETHTNSVLQTPFPFNPNGAILPSSSREHDSNIRPRPPPRSIRRPRGMSVDSQPRIVSSIQEELPDLELGSMSLAPIDTQQEPSNSHTTSASEEARISQAYGGNWRNSSVRTPDTLPSPVSPDLPIQNNQGLVYSSNLGRFREAAARPCSPITKYENDENDWEDVSSDSQTQNGRIHSPTRNYGPPLAPPPRRRLPEPPRPVKVSLFPAPDPRDTRRNLNTPSPITSLSPSSPVGRPEFGGLTTMGPNYRFRRMEDTRPQVDQSWRQPPVPSHMGTHGVNNYISPETDRNGWDLSTFPQPNTQGRNNAELSRTVPISNASPSLTSGPATIPPLSSIGRPNDRTLGVQPDTPLTNQLDYQEQQQTAFPPKPVKPKPKAVKAKAVNSYLFGDDVPIPKKSKKASKTNSVTSRNSSAQDSRSSVAPSMHSEGSSTMTTYVNLTQSVQQVPGVAAAPVDLIPSKGLSTRPADNLPTESNKYWGLCKNAAAKQTGDNKKPFEAAGSRPIGVMGTEKYMHCKKCKYEWNAYAKLAELKTAMTDPRWRAGPGGILYKESLLFKSHMPEKRAQLPQEEYHFGCIFCAALGNGMPVFLGKTSFLTHLAEHGNGRYPSDVLKTRIRFTTMPEWEAIEAEDEYHELVLP